MNARIWKLLAVVPIAAVAFGATADAAERAKKRYQSNSEAYEIDRRTGERIYSRPDRHGWYPHDAEKLKFGSQLWWDQMEREGRIGRRDW